MKINNIINSFKIGKMNEKYKNKKLKINEKSFKVKTKAKVIQN